MAERCLPALASHEPGADGPRAGQGFGCLTPTPAPGRTPELRGKRASLLAWSLPCLEG